MARAAMMGPEEFPPNRLRLYSPLYLVLLASLWVRVKNHGKHSETVILSRVVVEIVYDDAIHLPVEQRPFVSRCDRLASCEGLAPDLTAELVNIALGRRERSQQPESRIEVFRTVHPKFPHRLFP